MRRFFFSLTALALLVSITQVTPANAALGDSSASAARSLAEIVEQGAAHGPGLYWIDEDGPGGAAPQQIYSDMASQFVSRYSHQRASLGLAIEETPAAWVVAEIARPAVRPAAPTTVEAPTVKEKVALTVQRPSLAEKFLAPEMEDAWVQMKKHIEEGNGYGVWDSPGEMVLAWLPFLHGVAFYTEDGRFAFESDGRLASALPPEEEQAADSSERVEKQYANHGYGMSGADGGEKYIVYAKQRQVIAGLGTPKSQWTYYLGAIAAIGVWGLWSAAMERRPKQVGPNKEAIRPITHRSGRYRQKLYRSEFYRSVEAPLAVAMSGRTALQDGRLRMLPKP